MGPLISLGGPDGNNGVDNVKVFNSHHVNVEQVQHHGEYFKCKPYGSCHISDQQVGNKEVYMKLLVLIMTWINNEAGIIMVGSYIITST